MNYNFATRKADVADITITSGLVCHDCYAFIGGQLVFNIQYTLSGFFGFYVGLNGGAGFNIDLKADNPSISGSMTKTLAQASPDYFEIATFSG